MRNITITFPDDKKIEPVYRGKSITVEYNILSEEWGISVSLLYNGKEMSGHAREYATERIIGDRPIGELVENVVDRSEWPMRG